MGKIVLFAIIGAVLGIPLSYYLQPELVRMKVGGIFGYIEHFGDIIQNEDFFGNVVLSVVIFTVIGGLIGYFIEKNETRQSN